MRVLVSGSSRGMDASQLNALRQAAKDLGRSLAASGHTLLVGSDDQEDVDPFVVEGFLSDGKSSPVEVHLMRGAKRCYAGNSSVNCIWHRYDDWDVTVLEVVRGNADGLIVIGGQQGVVQAGIAGWMLGRAIIPFGGFDGGAAKVWGYGSSDRRRFYFDALTDAEIDQLDSPWTERTADTIVEQLVRCADYARRATVSLSVRLGVSLGILCMLVVWVLLLALPLLGWPQAPVITTPPEPQPLDIGGGIRLLLLLGSVCSAGCFGALVQTMRGIRGARATTAQRVWTDAILGVAAGFLTAALYMLAQIAITGKLEPPASNADYARVALIVSMASVFAALYLDSAFSRFDAVKESVMAGQFGEKKTGD